MSGWTAVSSTRSSTGWPRRHPLAAPPPPAAPPQDYRQQGLPASPARGYSSGRRPLPGLPATEEEGALALRALRLSRQPWPAARAGVEAHRRGGGEVEALGAAEDRDRDPVVGQRRELVGQAPRLVAEQPGDLLVEQPGALRLEQVGLPRAVGSEYDEPGGLGASYALGRVVGQRRSAGARGCRRSLGRSCRCRGRRCCRTSTTPAAPAASALRITVPALPGSRTSAQITRVAERPVVRGRRQRRLEPPRATCRGRRRGSGRPRRSPAA